MVLLGIIPKIFIIVCVLVKFIDCQSVSPCPRILRYFYDGHEWQVALEVNSPPIGGTMHLEVVFLVEIHNKVRGNMELWTPIQKITNGQKVRYRITFFPNPPMSQIPKVALITYNGKRICSDKPTLDGFFVRQIHLNHTLHSKHAKKNTPSTVKQEIIGRRKEPEVILQNRFATSESECGKIQPKFTVTNLIMNGNEMERGSWPWLVALHAYRSTDLSFICGGTLISERNIVSAAHCYHNRNQEEWLYPPQDVIAFLGKHNLRKLTESGAVIADIASIHIHPDFMRSTSGTMDADIAVLTMQKPAEFGDFIQPACLRFSSDRLSGGLGVIAGWGRDQSTNRPTNEPRRLEIPIASEAECLAEDKVRIITTPRTFCGGWRDRKRGPCHGDSGSGLLIYEDNKWQLAGIISMAVKHHLPGLCDLSQYVVFTDVSKFVNWIEQF